MDTDKLDEWWSSLSADQQAEALTLTRQSAVPEWFAPSCFAAKLRAVILVGWEDAEMVPIIPTAVLDYLKDKRDADY